MPATVNEINAKYKITGNPPVGVLRSFIIIGAADEEAALAALDASGFLDATLSIGGASLPLNDDTISLTEVDANEGVWSAEVSWGNAVTEAGSGAGSSPASGQAAPSDPGYPKYGFTVSAEQVLVRVSKETPAVFKPETAPDITASPTINDGENGPEGMSILSPVVNYRETYELAYTEWTAARRKTWAQAVGRTNLNAFRGYDIGEVLLTGIEVSDIFAQKPFLITFNFAISKNEVLTLPASIVTEGVSTGPSTITNEDISVTKKGWYLLDPVLNPATDPNSGKTAFYPAGYKVHKVYLGVTLNDTEGTPPI